MVVENKIKIINLHGDIIIKFILCFCGFFKRIFKDISLKCISVGRIIFVTYLLL